MNRGNLAEAQRWHRKLFPLCRDMLGLSTNPIPIKAAMKMLGRDPGELRLPMTELEDAGMTRLKKTLSDYGLL
jgi:4-hydroxy-tetrahydrodipicolinate synthase